MHSFQHTCGWILHIPHGKFTINLFQHIHKACYTISKRFTARKVAQTTCSRFFDFLELSPFLGIFDFRKTPWTRISTSTVMRNSVLKKKQLWGDVIKTLQSIPCNYREVYDMVRIIFFFVTSILPAGIGIGPTSPSDSSMSSAIVFFENDLQHFGALRCVCFQSTVAFSMWETQNSAR